MPPSHGFARASCTWEWMRRACPRPSCTRTMSSSLLPWALTELSSSCVRGAKSRAQSASPWPSPKR
eukprot:1046956-Pleurochrysis_carterae.AAC.1